MNAGQMMTWEDFKLKFSKYHVPQGLIKKMRDEFRELKQDRMSVVEYRDRFLTLSRYAPDETDTNEKRKERFLNGLIRLQRTVEEEIDEPESSLDEKEEEIDEPESSLDEKEEESDEQKEEEWISYPCQPSNESNSLSLTLFDCPPCLPKEVECYVPVDSLEIFPMSKTCESDYATVIYDNPCYFDKSYDNALFVPDVEMHGTKEFCLANVYDKSLDDGPMLLDNINCTTNENGIGEVLN
ncbi:hypothetical protein QYE76_016224 [Lolium multiflorum]|uniref:Retrotransposon gag domain-containing protein n=1 Tax=Lolium multiflorum TaxID=4521 RepID=A0AAD8X9X3_LOLMU|nr:hypothetical protein QYE76_016224 [Lolium multiflorum]